MCTRSVEEGEGRQRGCPRHLSLQARLARYLASTASSNSRRHHGVVIDAQARSTARCKPIVQVEVDRPGKLGTLAQGAQSGRPWKERQSGMVKVDSSLRGEVH